MWLPAVVGNGYEPLNDILDSGISITGVAVLVIAKIVAPSASVTSGIPGGVSRRCSWWERHSARAGRPWGAQCRIRPRQLRPREAWLQRRRPAIHASLTAAIMVFELRSWPPLHRRSAGGRRRDRPHPGWRAAPARGAGGRLPADGRHVGHPCSTIRPPATKAGSGPISIRSADRSSSMRRARTSATAPTYSRPTSAGSSRLGRCL